MKLSPFEIKAIIILILVIIAGYFLDKKESQKLEDQKVEIKSHFPPPPEGARNIDFKTGQWVVTETIIHQDQPSEILSDEEIRILREKQSFKPGGSYIYTPGRNVPTKQELIDKQIEEYIEKNGEDIYDELEDKYGN